VSIFTNQGYYIRTAQRKFVDPTPQEYEILQHELMMRLAEARETIIEIGHGGLLKTVPFMVWSDCACIISNTIPLMHTIECAISFQVKTAIDVFFSHVFLPNRRALCVQVTDRLVRQC
jgi:hypothetical protein